VWENRLIIKNEKHAFYVPWGSPWNLFYIKVSMVFFSFISGPEISWMVVEELVMYCKNKLIYCNFLSGKIAD